MSDFIRRAAERAREEEAARRKAPLQPQPRPVPVEEFRPAAQVQPLPRADTLVEPQIATANDIRRNSRQVTIDLNAWRREGFVCPGDEGTRLVEEMRLIKRPLLLNAFPESGERRHNAHLVMVAGSLRGEGATFFASNLAMSIAAEPSLNVLLVDANFHNPSIPSRMGFAAERGLADVLADKTVDLADVMLRTNVPNLSILPAGRSRARVPEMLASQRMADLVEDIAGRYPDRIVIFDAPPILMSSETNVLALHVGQIAMVVQAERTSRQQVNDALALLGDKAEIAFVLNRRSRLGMGPLSNMAEASAL